MEQIIIESSDPNDTPQDIEEKLEKAVAAIHQHREQKTFEDPYLQHEKDEADNIVTTVLDAMVEDIIELLGADHD